MYLLNIYDFINQLNTYFSLLVILTYLNNHPYQLIHHLQNFVLLLKLFLSYFISSNYLFIYQLISIVYFVNFMIYFSIMYVIVTVIFIVIFIVILNVNQLLLDF